MSIRRKLPYGSRMGSRSEHSIPTCIAFARLVIALRLASYRRVLRGTIASGQAAENH